MKEVERSIVVHNDLFLLFTCALFAAATFENVLRVDFEDAFNQVRGWVLKLVVFDYGLEQVFAFHVGVFYGRQDLSQLLLLIFCQFLTFFVILVPLHF